MVELIGTGIVCLVIGLFLVVLNRFYGQKEEEELQNYVETRLARTRSGQRLYHESDSYPDNLDENCSRSPSMDSGVSNDYASSSKNKRKNKKAAAKSEALFRSQPPPTTVSVINEHNHQPPLHHNPHHQQQQHNPQQHKTSSGGIEDISTLERISEEASAAADMARHNSSHSQHHHQHHSQHSQHSHHSPHHNNSSDVDPSGYSSSRGGGNLYRVYDATTA